jgi:hypothetical protein
MWMWTRHLAVWTVLCLRQQVRRYESWCRILVCYDQDLQEHVMVLHVMWLFLAWHTSGD